VIDVHVMLQRRYKFIAGDHRVLTAPVFRCRRQNSA